MTNCKNTLYVCRVQLKKQKRQSTMLWKKLRSSGLSNCGLGKYATNLAIAALAMAL